MSLHSSDSSLKCIIMLMTSSFILITVIHRKASPTPLIGCQAKIRIQDLPGALTTLLPHPSKLRLPSSCGECFSILEFPSFLCFFAVPCCLPIICSSLVRTVLLHNGGSCKVCTIKRSITLLCIPKQSTWQNGVIPSLLPIINIYFNHFR